MLLSFRKNYFKNEKADCKTWTKGNKTKLSIKKLQKHHELHTASFGREHASFEMFQVNAIEMYVFFAYSGLN